MPILAQDFAPPLPNWLLVQSLESYLNDLASARPTPGGGSAAILVAALGASLVAMVARICSANPKYSGHRALAEDVAARADALRATLLAARPHDEAAFEKVVAATALPRGNDAERALRSAELESALAGAAAEPLKAAQLALAVLVAARDLLVIPNRTLSSDVGSAAEFAHAAVAACAYNVRINHRFMKDGQRTAEQAREIVEFEHAAELLLGEIRSALR